jgi:predicted acylesterase/phospholipase RssA
LGARLLADLVDLCPVYGYDDTGELTVQSVEEVAPRKSTVAADMLTAPILAVAVIEGVAKVRHRAPSPSSAGGPRPEVLLPVGVYDRFDAGLTEFPLGNLRLDPLKVHKQFQPLKLLVVPRQVALACPEMIHRIIAAEASKADKKKLALLAKPELILFDAQDEYQSELRPMLHALATAVARGGRKTALVEFGEKFEAVTWNDKTDKFAPKKLASPSKEQDLRALLGLHVQGSVFVARPPDAANRAMVDAMKFDRVVYLTGRVPRALPNDLRPPLLPIELFDTSQDAQHQEPYLGAFMPTVVVPFHNPPPGASGGRFGAMEVAHSRIPTGVDEPPRGLRPYRDSCVLPVRRGRLRKAWQAWLPQWEAGTAAAPFLDDAVGVEALRPESAERWVRALHWRRVGVALSGGGACAYRFVPVLEQLRKRHVPVDVFAGLSGGALLGVFYCLRGRDGLREYVNLGALTQVLMPLASWSTDPFECTTDYFTGSARIEGLEVRLAAVTVAMPDDGPPYGAVVVQGTLGEAARASGTLPPSYAATEKDGIRYADGGACTAVPARVVRDSGADVILACNAIPGPDSCNPYPKNIFGDVLRRVLRRVPPWDRLIDFQTWRSFQWQQASRAFGEEADVYFEFLPSEMSIGEPALFIRARSIIAAANRQLPMIKEKLDEFEKAWKALG